MQGSLSGEKCSFLGSAVAFRSAAALLGRGKRGRRHRLKPENC